MANFEAPLSGDLAQYHISGDLALRSVAKMDIDVAGHGYEIALYGGDDLTVRSSDTFVVTGPIAERGGDGRRILRVVGKNPGLAALEAGLWAGDRWAPGLPGSRSS